MNTLCRLFGYSRQSFYNREDPDNDFVDNALETMIVEKAREYRKDNPGLGCAKLYLSSNACLNPLIVCLDEMRS